MPQEPIKGVRRFLLELKSRTMHARLCFRRGASSFPNRFFYGCRFWRVTDVVVRRRKTVLKNGGKGRSMRRRHT